jgi:hypothetical protein
MTSCRAFTEYINLVGVQWVRLFSVDACVIHHRQLYVRIALTNFFVHIRLLYIFLLHRCADAGRFLYLLFFFKKSFLIVSLSAIFLRLLLDVFCVCAFIRLQGIFTKEFYFILFYFFFSFLFSSPLRYLITRWNFKNTKPHVNL